MKNIKAKTLRSHNDVKSLGLGQRLKLLLFFPHAACTSVETEVTEMVPLVKLNFFSCSNSNTFSFCCIWIHTSFVCHFPTVLFTPINSKRTRCVHNLHTLYRISEVQIPYILEIAHSLISYAFSRLYTVMNT